MFPESLRYLDVSKNRLDNAGLNEILDRLPTSALRPSHDASSHARGPQSKPMSHKQPVTTTSPGLQSLICRENRLAEVPRLLYKQIHTLRELQVSVFDIL
jgi:hypothetical protein